MFNTFTNRMAYATLQSSSKGKNGEPVSSLDPESQSRDKDHRADLLREIKRISCAEAQKMDVRDYTCCK